MGYPPEFWERVRDDYESGKAGISALARTYNVSREAINYQRKHNGWVKGVPEPEREYESDEYLESAANEFVDEPEAPISDDLPPPVEAITGQTIESEPAETETVTSPETFEMEPVDVSSYEQRIAELEAKLEEAEAEARMHDPRIDVPFLATTEDYLEHIGYEDLKELALSELGRENIKRHRDGKPPLEFGDDRIEATIQDIINRRLRNMTSNVRQEDNMRTLKMVKPNGTMTQVPVETQINNEAGQQGAAIWKAREKGFKIAYPYRCHRHNCWQLAASDESGRLIMDGYCTPEHRAQDPYLNTSAVAGVSMSGMPMQSSRDSGRADTYLERMGT